MKIAFVGTGYVGLVSGTCLAEMGHVVTCHDIDAKRIARLNKGRSPIFEPGLAELLRRNIDNGRLTFTSDVSAAIANATVVILAVGSPAAKDGSADPQYVLAAARSVAEHMTGSLLLVIKSTVPVGTCEHVHELVASVLSERGLQCEFSVVSNPEFLKEGAAIDDFMRPDRIVIGVSEKSAAETMRRLYEPFTRNGHPILEMSVRDAEMTKYAANAMLAARISMVNEFSRIADAVGADIMNVRRGVGTDKRLGMSFLYPGVGYGGSCFSKDLRGLANMSSCATPMLDAIERVNESQKMLLAERVVEYFGGTLKGRHIALWGLAFKPNTDDIREAPALRIIDVLLEAGACICAFDPEAMPNAKRQLRPYAELSFSKSAIDATTDADAIVLVTEWSEFRAPDFETIREQMRTPILFDGRNLFDPQVMKKLGFTYSCIGRPQT